MVNETQFPLIERLLKICGIVVVVLSAASLFYLAPLAVLARLEAPSGKRWLLELTIDIGAQSSDPPLATNGSERDRFTEPNAVYRKTRLSHRLDIPALDSIYRPILDYLGGYEIGQASKITKFVLGID